MELEAPSCESVKYHPQIFADHAVAMRRAGFAVVPANGKKPLRDNFNKWRHAPGEKVVGEWAAKMPDADIVIVPGLSRHRRGGDRLIIVDGDDQIACGQSIELFGDSPGKAKTRRGAHTYFRYDGPDLGTLGSLRKFGFNIDVKHGQRGAGIVAAPPSRHEKDRSFQYAWDGCDETVIRDLPKFNINALEAILSRGVVTPSGTQAELKARAGYRSASRTLQLNDLIYGRSRSVTDPQELMAIAHKWNRSNEALGIIPLEDAQVMQIVNAVLKERETKEVENWHGRRATVRSDLDEMTELAAISKNGSDAFFLLMKLRGEHGARMAKDETFALNCVAMAEHGTIPNWTRYDYEKARNVLVQAGKLQQVSKFSMSRDGRRPAQFRLTPFRAE